MVTDGEVIASTVVEEEPTSAAMETAADMFMQPIAEVAHRE
jgi:hypothetical protein